ncbi:MAG: DUF2188 domain-containing protein [Candidatus Caccosoma sp.]|nr:DUF2188 domain-containing protein [Candidatus Caccosoma sp.]
MNRKQKVICRPCAEQNNWEIQAPDGHVYSKHYQTKQECVKQGRKYAEEFACDLVIEDKEDQY